MGYPKMARIRQRFDAPVVEDIAAAVRRELEQIGVLSAVRDEETVAITAGSRGIAQFDLILKTIVDVLHEVGARPFIVPAMGSHGGATAEGQVDVLGHYGITEERMGAPIRSSMEVVQVGQTRDGFPVYLDRYAAEADHIAVVNRVKPHTEFGGQIQSGLIKMMLIGLGKHKGAKLYHQVAVRRPFDEVAEAVAHVVLDRCPILFGLAILENGYNQIARLVAVRPSELMSTDQALQKVAARLMARIPFDEVDLLIVDQMGKNISGSGMDSTVLGRKSWSGFTHIENERPLVRRVFVRDLTPESQGNAAGIGLADFTVRRLVDTIDLPKTYINCLTSIRPTGAMIPLTLETDREAVDAALSTVGLLDPTAAKVVWIKNTLQLEEMGVSEAYAGEIEERSGLERIGAWTTMRFGSSGDLASLD